MYNILEISLLDYIHYHWDRVAKNNPNYKITYTEFQQIWKTIYYQEKCGALERKVNEMLTENKNLSNILSVGEKAALLATGALIDANKRIMRLEELIDKADNGFPFSDYLYLHRDLEESKLKIKEACNIIKIKINELEGK